ncbi:MAG: molybdopterin biosynthesis protein MoeB, partial [Staphylococcus warneri]|nr:molybdopterin biosynthesis protein MoeB [Staphylococcus warneri]
KYGDIWEGYHHAIGFKNMHNDTCPTCGKTPNYPFLKRNQRQYTTLCGRDTVQYNNSTISQEMLEAFLKTHHIQYKQNPYMIVFTFNGYRIVAFNGGRLLIHGMNNPNEATKLINQLFG